MNPADTAKRFVDFAVRIKRLFRSGVVQGGLSDERFRTLLFLDDAEGTGLTELSERILISPPSLCIMLKKLEEESFVARSRDEKDRRGVRYSRTEKGTAALRAEKDRRLAVFAALFGALSEDERGRLVAAIDEVESLVEVLIPR